LAMQQWSILESGFRCDGHFALGTFCTAIQRFIEAAAATIVGIVSGSLLLMAASYLGLRLLGLICYRSLLKRVSPWLQLGLNYANSGTIRRMLRPSFGFIAMPLGSATNIQGSLLVVGFVLGPIAVTVFSTARTLTRIGVQITNTLANGIWPELSMAFGAGNLPLARKLHRHAYQASLILAVLCAASLWLFGPTFYHAWVRRAVALDLSCFHALLLVSIATSFWFPSAMVQMSTNRHSGLALIYFTTTVASCVSGYFLNRRLGLFGAAVTPLLIDIVMCSIVVPRSLQQMKDTPHEFLRFVFGSTPYFVRPLLNYRLLK
jgi:O-antigen/teichoic acid export membrane protein